MAPGFGGAMREKERQPCPRGPNIGGGGCGVELSWHRDADRPLGEAAVLFPLPRENREMTIRWGLAGVWVLTAAMPIWAEAQIVPSSAGGSVGVAVLGRVIDIRSAEPIPSVRVAFRLPDTEGEPVWQGLSGSTGTFVTSRMEPGDYEVEVQMLGYADILNRITFALDGDVDLRIELVPEALTLEPVVVAVRRRSRLETQGFYERQAMGIGYFLNRADIEMRNPWRVADLFYGIPGARVIPATVGQPVPNVLLRRNCVPLIVLNGAPISNRIRLDDILHPQDVEAVEVYHGSSAPIQYSQFTTCGTIMVWTRETRLMEGQPFSWGRLLRAGGVAAALFLITR